MGQLAQLIGGAAALQTLAIMQVQKQCMHVHAHHACEHDLSRSTLEFVTQSGQVRCLIYVAPAVAMHGLVTGHAYLDIAPAGCVHKRVAVPQIFFAHVEDQRRV